MKTREKLGIGIFFVAGILMGLSPFVPGFLYDWGFNPDYTKVGIDGYIRGAIGFFFVFGAKYFNSISATIGDGIKERIGIKNQEK